MLRHLQTIRNGNHLILVNSAWEDDFNKELGEAKEFTRIAQWKHKEMLYILGEGLCPNFSWSQWQLERLKRVKIESIKDGARKLRAIGKYWVPLKGELFRRMSLIQNELPKIPKRNWVPGSRSKEFRAIRCGAWFLVSPDELIYTSEVEIPYSNGKIDLCEDKEAPSRAFQKLDEVFLRKGLFPQPNENVIDLGSYPGGWTWVLSELAHKVYSVDTVPLKIDLFKKRNVIQIKQSAFSLKSQDFNDCDWLFSDIICDPNKLYDFIKRIINETSIKKFVCTLKFKGETDFIAIKKFRSIKGSEVFHLNSNKHELTWVYFR